MSTALVSQNELGLKNTPAINANVERHALLYRSVKCGVLILVSRKRPGVPKSSDPLSPFWPAPHDALAIKMVPRVYNVILGDSAIRLRASYRALAYTQHPHPDPASRLTIDVRIDARAMYYLNIVPSSRHHLRPTKQHISKRHSTRSKHLLASSSNSPSGKIYATS